MSALRTAVALHGRCTSCESALFVRLARRDGGRLERTVYCASCDRARDVTSNLARRAAYSLAATREVA